METGIKVLIIDDEIQLRTLLARIISLEGYEVIQADSLANAKKQILKNHPDIVLCDVFLPDGNGVDAISQLKELMLNGEIIMLTAHGNISDGVKAIKNGAYDYLTKGDDNKRIVPMLANTTEKLMLKKKLSTLESLIDKKYYTFDSIIGNSNIIRKTVDLAKKAAPTDTAVLLTGETGTGKEVFANAIHQASGRNQKPFVAVNCGALSPQLLESEMFGYKAGAFTGATKDKKGLFEQADKGTMFLDEIGDMPIDLQVKLLRVLETGEFIPVGDTKITKVDVRIVAATNCHLKKQVAQGKFREDLYYRLSVFSIEIPPLRDRGDDVVLLAKRFIEGFKAKMNKTITDIDDTFFQTLKQYSWRGNIRELRNTMERSVILASENRLQAADLPLEIRMIQTNQNNTMELAAVEKQHMIKILSYTSGNKTEAARLMKIGLTTLYRKIEEYGIDGELKEIYE